MIAFVKRNLKLYLRDRAGVFFSLLGVLIIIGLYVLFLGDVWTRDIGEYEGVREIMDDWVMAGVLAVTSVTTTLGMLGTMVKDKVDKIEKDIYVAPVKRSAIAGGYLLSAYIVGVVMSLIALVVAEIYIRSNGGAFLSFNHLLLVIGSILLTALMNTAIILFLVSCFKSLNAFSTASSVIGTLIGFITGIYLPIGMYPDAVQWMIKVFPVAHAARLFRGLMMKDSMDRVFAGAPAEVITEFKVQFGVTYQYGDTTFPIWGSILVMIITIAIFFGLAAWNLSRKRK